MADSSSGGKSPNQKASGEMSMEGRLMLALALMGAIIFGMPYFYQWISPQSAAKKKSDPPPAAQTKQAAPEQVPDVKAAAPAPAPAGSAAPVTAASAEQTVTIDTDLYRVELSNRGAVVRSWKLKKYTDHAKKPVELVNPTAIAKVGYPFAYAFQDRKPSTDLNQSLFTVKQDGLNVTFDFSDGKVRATKTFQFRPNRYVSDVKSSVSEGGSGIAHMLAWRGGFGDITVPAAAPLQHAIYYDTANSKLNVHDASKAKDGVLTERGTYSFAGLEDTYFTAVFLPEGSNQLTIQTFSDPVASPVEPKEVAHVGAAIGGSAANNLSVFVGPKDLDTLRAVNPRLEQVVDWGWFGFIAKPVFLMIHWLNDQLIHNYGWSIILVTIFINMALLPLKMTSLKSMKKMSVLQPQIQAINDRYRNLKMNDPKRQRQNQEIMELYQKHGVNPLGGCVPLALQMPFLFAFYKVFTIAIEMRGASWLWVQDLSQPETIPIRILPLTMIGTQFLLQKMTPSTTADPAQQKMMLFMPLVFGFMFYGSSSGLMLYWLTGNLVAMAQQWFFNKTAIVDGPTPPPKKSVRK